MAGATRPRLMSTASQWLAVSVCAVLGIALVAFVDLTPHLRSDFFFANDDPALRQAAALERQFGQAPQIFIAASSPHLESAAYLRKVRALTVALARLEGVADVRSIANGPEKLDEIAERDADDVFKDLRKSPWWSHLLLSPDDSASFIVLRLKEHANHTTAIEAIDQVIDRQDEPGFRLAVAGAPYVAEHLRSQLWKELRFFSVAAFVAFGVLIALIFRSLAVLTGTMVAALAACFATFLIRALAGMPTDVLTPNLWTIAFVLTLSHVVYLAIEWRGQAREVGSVEAVRTSIRQVGPASAWSFVANLLGFGSLLFVSARPLREFGMSGAIAAAAAMACAYLLFPPFLASANPGVAHAATATSRVGAFFTARHPWIAGLAVVLALALAPLAYRVNTDPSLPSYFPSQQRVGQGLRAIDRASGSSPLDLVVADAHGGRLDNGDAFDRLMALQHDLERQRDVGAVISIALLMAESKRPWYSFLVSWDRRIRALEDPERGSIGRAFITQDRRQARFVLRMHEAARKRPRDDVVREIEGVVRRHGFKPALVAGLYPLQGTMSELVEGSVLRGLAGLIGLFTVIALVITRSVRTALAMAASLVMTPLALFGFVSLFGMPVDIISAPAANVALPMGIDEMIHMGYAVRRRGSAGDRWLAWRAALQKLWLPVLASMLIVVSGFLLFLLSAFPPTQRLGVLVCIGAALTDLAVLVVLPALATGRIRKKRDATDAASRG